jgi:hypothetical protein
MSVVTAETPATGKAAIKINAARRAGLKIAVRVVEIRHPSGTLAYSATIHNATR